MAGSFLFEDGMLFSIIAGVLDLKIRVSKALVDLSEMEKKLFVK